MWKKKILSVELIFQVEKQMPQQVLKSFYLFRDNGIFLLLLLGVTLYFSKDHCLHFSITLFSTVTEHNICDLAMYFTDTCL